ncbi:MAG: chromate transporter [Angelakisella sp.]|nr:chromate transporter [Angelakisella sp.]
MRQKNILFDLLLTFLKIGLFTFGGGYAMLAMIENSCVTEKGWISHDDMMNVTVIAESTPGPIAINCATFVGYRQAGLWGALAATLGIVLPSFVIIYSISSLLDNFLEIAVIASAFRGIRIGVGFLILQAAAGMVKKMPKKPLPLAIMAASFLLMLSANLFSWKLSSISLMLLAGVVSLGLFAAGAGKGGNKG